MKRILILLTTCLFAYLQANTKDDVIAYEKKRLSKNTYIEVLGLKLNNARDLKHNNWFVYSFDVRFKNKSTNETNNAKDILFSDGKVITSELFDIKTNKNLKDKLHPPLSKKYYDDKRRIVGAKNAKTKIVVFSDPLCPYCKGLNPDLIRYAKKHKNIAVYYFHFPLTQLHKASYFISQIMARANKDGMKDVEYKIYTANFNKYFLPDEKDKEKILKSVNKALGTKYTIKQVYTKQTKAMVDEDIKMGNQVDVGGTPTVFINGEFTSNPKDFKNYK